MKHESKKLTLVINEILTYLLQQGATDLDINVHTDLSCSKVTFIQSNCTYSQEFVQQLDHNLNTQRQNEIEGYYWQLVGKDDTGDEIHLVGAMIDSATITYEKGVLTILITRNAK